MVKSNKKVATVNSKGKVTAKQNGTATITAKVGNKKLTCKVKVRLLQFNEKFYSLKDASKAYIKVSKIKNSKTYKYDLDGDKKKDTITITKNKNDTAGYYRVKLNGKQFYYLHSLGEIYIVDLNKNDKTTEIVIADQEAGVYCEYSIWSKKGSKMKKLSSNMEIYNESTLRINKKGKIIYDEGFFRIVPQIYQKYYIFSNNKLKTKKLNVKNISKKTFTTTDKYQIFTTNKKIINADLADGSTYDKIKTINVKKNTKFKIIKFVNNKIINVKLSNGQKGYLFVTGI